MGEEARQRMSGSEEATVRLACMEDYEPVSRLMDSLDALHRTRLPWMFRVPGEPPRPRAHFARLLASDDSAVFVAEAASVVGVAVGFMRSAPELPVFVQQTCVVLDSLVVDPAWRRRGLGRRLARSVEGWGFGAHAAWLEVNVYEVNPEARGFYQALGYLPLSTKLCLEPRGEGHRR